MNHVPIEFNTLFELCNEWFDNTFKYFGYLKLIIFIHHIHFKNNFTDIKIYWL